MVTADTFFLPVDVNDKRGGIRVCVDDHEGPMDLLGSLFCRYWFVVYTKSPILTSAMRVATRWSKLRL